jgi:hypothetical protein
MGIVLLGAVALLLGLGLLYGFTQANVQALARSLRNLGMIVLALAALGLVAMDRIGLAVFAGSIAWSLFTRGRVWPGGWPRFGRGGGGTRYRSQQSSQVRTEWVVMALDHMSGAMDGTVLKGREKGAALDALSQERLIALYEEAGGDGETLRLLDAYLDRRFGSVWREAQKARARNGASRCGNRMSRKEALHVLGLEDGAGTQSIRDAHRRLMKQCHPDLGGSSYLAAKINEAKEVLLGS